MKDQELFDIEDVDYDWEYSKDGKRVTLKMNSVNRFNLMRTYLSLRSLIDKIELQIGVSEPDGSEH